MVASLMCAAELLDGSDDVLIAYGDIVYEASIVRAMMECQEPICTAVDLEWLKLWRLRMQDPLRDAETLKLAPSGDIRELGKPPRVIDDIEGQYMGLTKARAGLAPRLVSCYQRLEEEAGVVAEDPSTMFMTDFLQRLIDDGLPVRAVPVRGGWLEVDTAADLETYERLLAEDRLGEFWGPEPVEAR
jgi:choline kinase